MTDDSPAAARPAFPVLRRLWDLPTFLLVATTAIWGLNSTVSRLAVGAVSPMALTFLRWIGAAIMLAPLISGQIREAWPAVRARPWLPLGLGLVGFTGFNALFYVAASMTEAVNLSIIQGAIPVFALAMNRVVHRERVSATTAAGVAVTLAGVGLVACAGDPRRLLSLSFNGGDLLVLLACVLFAAYTVGLKSRPAAPQLGYFYYLVLAAAFTAAPLAAGEAMRGHWLWPQGATGWGVVIFTVVFVSIASQVMFMRGVALAGPARAGVYVNLVPAFGAAFAVAILGEPFEAWRALALALVVAGIFVAERGKGRN
ncbi:MAG: DMT family transporter [Hyphomicrobiales bacterium]|nr:DMT family transporter [Hyphomicrobiales bacterium]MDE2016211.1 DMT family transporter [Hyphomicrobiales bacterium]